MKPQSKCNDNTCDNKTNVQSLLSKPSTTSNASNAVCGDTWTCAGVESWGTSLSFSVVIFLPSSLHRVDLRSGKIELVLLEGTV